jgi:UDP-N-acetylmuramyl pentapeptide phosphotransferase/UDP-N-acetylglucosamine-1-phosphate transferase
MGGILGFLRYNFHKAIIFMGDAGSLVCGFIIAVLAIQFVEMQATEAAPSIAMGILIIPIWDTLRVTIIRLLKGISPFTPDKNHIHHKLIVLGFSQIGTVLILGFVNLLIVAFVISCRELGSNYLLLVLIVLSVIFSIVLEFLMKFKRVSG